MKLFVAGCSFSDYTKVDTAYGEYLSELLKCQYVHEGAGCGSNWRIWRKITGHILNGNLTPNDLLVVQYTKPEREEFWSRYPQPDRLFYKKLGAADKHPEGTILRFKSGASQWQTNIEESKFFDTYENNFLNLNFELERFQVHNFMFQKMLLQNNHINTIFIRSHRYPLSDIYVLPEFLENSFTEPTGNLVEYDLSPEDAGHMSQHGHKVFAQWLFEHINKKRILKCS